MSTVELIFDATCPNVDTTRAQLRDALRRAGRTAAWIEWDRAATDAPPYTRQYASPTVLVDGRDVAGGDTLDAGSGCRVIMPTSTLILAALLAADHV